jgi:hypothetical protein
MIKEPGNLAAGFDEGLVDNKGNVVWPDPNSQPPMVGGKSVYPIKPHELNADDWIYANTGVAISGGVEAALKEHIDKKNVLILPIVSPAVGTGSKATFQVKGLGAFYLVGIPGYGTGVGGKQGANGFFDLVYIGPANSIACLSTPAVTSSTLGVTGSVFFKPRWGLRQGSQPIAFEVILDVSGSMSWNFDGQGSSGGSIKFEADTTGGTTAKNCEYTASVPNPSTCDGGISDPWKDVESRRIYVAKQALAGPGGLIANMAPNDAMRVIAFSSEGNGIDANSGWTHDQSTLVQTVMNAGKYSNGDRYRTRGGTPGPKALETAYKVLQNSDPPPLSGGLEYRHVVIYMTDGVANIFLNGATNWAKDICPEYNGGSRALNVPRCQFDPPPDYKPHPTNGMRPISSMIHQAGQMKDTFPNLQLFVVAMGQVDTQGLDQIASNADFVFPARQPDKVKAAIDQIRGAIAAPCTPSGGANWEDFIDAAHTDTASGLPSGVFGYVYLYDKNHAPVNLPWTRGGADPRGAATNALPITQDSISGKLSYALPPNAGLPPGVYYQTAYVRYKAVEGDGKVRQYDQLVYGLDPVPQIPFTLTPDNVLGGSVVLDPLRLDLRDNINLCAL